MPEYFILQEGEGFVGNPPSFSSLEKAVDNYFAGVRLSSDFGSRKNSQKARFLAKKLEVKFSEEGKDDKVCLEFPQPVSNHTPIFVIEQYQKWVDTSDYEGYNEDIYRIRLFKNLQEALESLKSSSGGKITLAKCLDFKGVVSER